MYKNLCEKPIAQWQKETADRWYQEDAYKKIVDSREGCPDFVWVEGPPTANGHPGIHHVMARSLKDSVLRYKVMRGYKVKPRGGWDTHGLPVELEVEKQLGFKDKKDIENFGIENFNEKCKESVFKYVGEWEDMSKRMGMFLDMDNSYVTYYDDYIETEWWILNNVFERGLIYEGHKIVPYCPRCGTGLASHEVAQGYEEMPVLTLTCKFKKKNTENEYFLAWTTTAWTLLSNVALTVHPDLTYVWVNMTEGPEAGNKFCLAKEALDRVLKEGNYEVIKEISGKELEYQEYEQLMDFVEVDKKAFFVTCADYVNAEDGTGIVHSAPAFGEDDYNMGVSYGLPVVQPVDLEGKFTVGPWKGRFIMEDGMDKEIMGYLGSEKVFAKERIVHNYPSCWRCHTPLVYYANPSWYISMSDLRDELVANNNTVNWYPDFVGERRFGNWLESVKDWAISRNRYWGTPIPIWRCECGHLESVESKKVLVEKAIEDIDESIELHRPYVDEVHIRCPRCGKEMSRISEVMDCWFDSGAAPFAQDHWPFANTEGVDVAKIPMDFICEGIDQTRGWFYSLMAVSTLVKNQAPYKNVLVNDLILDKHGKKMSKHVGNTVNPFEMFDKYGADASRWYLLSTSPAWTPTKFDEDGLKDIVSKFFGTLRNVYNFFVLYSNQDDIDCAALDVKAELRTELDKWILSKYNRLVEKVLFEMEQYDHMKTVHAIQDFVAEDLSNWYIRRARRRFWQSEMNDDKKSVYATTYEILKGVAKLMAPFAPFLSDEIYTNLTGEYTVHTAYYPEVDRSLINEAIENRMDLVRSIVSLGRGAREKEQIKVRQPISRIILDKKNEDMISDLNPLIMEELNVKEVVYEEDMTKYMSYSIKPDFKTAGPVLGPKVKVFGKLLAESVPKEFMNNIGSGITLDLDGETFEITRDMVDLRIVGEAGYSVGIDQDISVAVATELTPELITEGLAREIVSKVQQLRKQHELEMMDNIKIILDAGDEVKKAVQEYKDYIMTETLATSLDYGKTEESFKVNGHETGIGIEKV